MTQIVRISTDLQNGVNPLNQRFSASNFFAKIYEK
jgi:hypothetical protein